MTIPHGSIEVISGEDSYGFVFADFDDAQVADEVKLIADTDILGEEPNPYAASGCHSVWHGRAADGRFAQVRVWKLNP